MKKAIPLLLAIVLTSFYACTDNELAQQLETAKKQLAEAKTKIADPQSAQPGLIHTVLFWLKEDVTQAQRAAFEEGLKSLTKVGSVRKLFYGPPSGPSEKADDNPYDYALFVYFDNKEGLDLYSKDKTHLALIDKFKNSWERVQVFNTKVE